MSRMMVMVAMLAAASLAGAQQVTTAEEETRGFLFELGVGAAGAVYPEPLESDVRATAALPGVSRSTIVLHLTAGWAVGRSTYATLGVYGVGDRLIDGSGQWVQINGYLYGPGVRYYPWDTGLVIGIDAGAGRMVAQATGVGSSVSPWGAAWRGVAAYDFSRRRTGFSVAAGLSVGALVIEGERVGYASLFASVGWK